MSIRGVLPPIATPFNSQGNLHAGALAANIARWNETGLSGYVVAGSNGESVLLEEAEIVEALRIVCRAALPHQLVVAGTGRESTAATTRLTKAAADAGAHIALVMTPSFYGGEMTADALMRHYEAVADASPIPVMVYNVPKFTHLNIAPETVARLSAHKNIVGVKDSAGSVEQVAELVRLCPRSFDVLVGNASAYLGGLQAGAAGGILALANVAPRECVAIARLLRDGQIEQAKEIHERMAPVARAVTTGYGVPGLKAALDHLGYYGGQPRPPLLPLDETTRGVVRQILVQAGLL